MLQPTHTHRLIYARVSVRPFKKPVVALGTGM